MKLLIARLIKAFVTLASIVLLLTGCTTSGAIQHAHWHYLDGNTDAAVDALDNADIAAKDQLLYWLEKGMYLHYSGDYKESTEALLKAATHVEATDYIRLSDEAKFLVANEWAGHYRGEYSERLWIHSVLMMNFLRMGLYESAAVEARRSLEVISRFPDTLELDHFTRALIAISFEAAGQLNDAYIVNNSLAESTDDFDLHRVVDTQAAKLGFTMTVPVKAAMPQQYAIVFISNGTIPVKFSGSLITGDASRVSFPEYFVPLGGPPNHTVAIDDVPCDCMMIYSDFGELVSDSLGRRGAALVTRAAFRAATKDAIADAIEDEDELAGAIARVLLFALEEADTRSWRSLPRHYSLLRIPITAEAEKLTVNVGSTSHVIELPESRGRQPFLFYSLHNQFSY